MGTTLSVFVPKGTPNDVGRRLNAAVVRALANPMVRRRLVRPADAAAAYQKAERNGGRSSTSIAT
jgi:tripartite-type tricarboxylate transporter receptor subunit TctC